MTEPFVWSAGIGKTGLCIGSQNDKIFVFRGDQGKIFGINWQENQGDKIYERALTDYLTYGASNKFDPINLFLSFIFYPFLECL